ncbi:MAG: 4Fe-4S binding protein [Ignavibacteriae bacterium]|nr:4Fe-4S binding protein [Ignavibacteriota bacterium]
MNLIQIDIPQESHAVNDSPLKKGGLALFAIGLLIFLIGAFGSFENYSLFYSIGSLGLATFGALLFIFPSRNEGLPGIKNNGVFFRAASNRGAIAWITAVFLTAFYVVLYWFPEYFVHLIKSTDPISYAMTGKAANQWFLYGTLYTLSVLVMGVKMLFKYRHIRYQIIRTLSVMFFQLVFSFLIPHFLEALNQPEYYFSYFWPLKTSVLFPNDINWLLSKPGALPQFMVFWGVTMSLIGVPIFTYFFGKRWYCSFVCGCGGLAETMGDPYRQNSDKSLQAWKIERWMVHSVLLFITVTTGLLWANSYYQGALLGSLSQGFSKTYGFLIGAAFSGVIGVGFYPIMGSRVWCRFGCPQAAILGIFQKYFSRFRITTNGSQCISCGNCSTYCEMGIDVRSYAQRGENIVRASCVGCGVCSSVCPRGVLNLENGPVKGRVMK